MDSRLRNLEETLAALRDQVARLELRVESLESIPAARAQVAPTAGPATAPLEPSSADVRGALARTPVLAGRSLIVLAGAFLLRAVSEGGGLPLVAGVAIGLAYAVLWLAMAVRTALAGERLSASLHGTCAAAIALPLLWEASARFETIPAPASASLVALFTAAGLWVSVRGRLPVTGWIFSGGAVLTLMAIAFSRPPGLTSTALLVALAACLALLGCFDRWSPLHWFVAGAADLAVLRLVSLAVASVDPSRHRIPVSPTWVVAIAAATTALWLGVLFERTGRRRLPIRPFDLAQATAGLAVGLGGTLWVAHATGAGVWWLGVASLLVACAATALAFTSIDRSTGRGPHFLLYSTLGLVCVLVGIPVLAGRGGSAWIWSLLAVLAALLGGRYDRVTLRAHALVYAAAATIASGAFSRALDGLLSSDPTARWSGATFAGSGALAAVLLSAILTAAYRRRIRPTWAARLPLTILVGFAALLTVGHLVAAVAVGIGLLGAEPSGSVASARTVLASTAAIGLAALRRTGGLPEAAWIAYPALALALAELVVGDLAVGSARTLFLSFLVTGSALAVSPWLLRAPPADRHTSVGPISSEAIRPPPRSEPSTPP